MGRSKQKASSSSRGYTSRNQLAMMINNGVKNAKRIEYDISHETSFYDHYFSYDKNQDQGIEEEIKSDYAPFITMAVTTNDKNNPFPRVIVDKNNTIDSNYGNDLLNSLDDLAIFISNFDDEKKEEKKEEKTEEFEKKIDENAQQIEYWLGWHETSKYDGMHGMLKYGRPDLMLVFVLDISGSMGSPFKESGVEYSVGSRKNTKSMSKIQIAKKVLIKFLDQLQKNDYFGLVVFNSETEIIHNIEQWGNTKVEEVIDKINKLESGGGTVITTAYNTACKMLLEDCPALQKFEKRLFFLTDMEVSTSEGNEYTKLVSKNAINEYVYSSVTGIGLDLSNGVITRLSSTMGCNYSNVLNSDDFVEIINYEFNYMVTPIAMNVKLTILSDHEIMGGYGSFEVRNISKMANKKQCGQITRFPSQCNYKGERRSGVILLKLKSSDFTKNKIVRLKISYDDVNGENKEIFFKKNFNKMRLNEGENNGIKKAILLKNYVDFIQFYLKLRLKYNPSKKEIELFTKWNKIKYYQYFEHMIQNLVQLNDASLMEELKILKWVGNHDNIKFSDSIQQSINNVRIWDNLFFCPSGTNEKQPALFPNLIKVISNTSEMESLITGFLRYNTYDDATVSMDILKIIPMYLLPIAFYTKNNKKE